MSVTSIQTKGWVLAAVVALSMAVVSRAAVVGNVNIANGVGGGITLTSTAIDFLLPSAGGNGAMASGLGTSLGYTGGGPLIAGSTGTVQDFTLVGVPVPNFMLFASEPLLSFDLISIGPGVANTAAVNTFDPNSAPSSPSVGSPYILQATSTGTTLTFSVAGIAHDASSPDSAWTGLFTTQLAGVTPFQVQQALVGGGAVSSTYSASIAATGFIPEPAFTGLLLGLAPLLGLRRRR